MRVPIFNFVVWGVFLISLSACANSQKEIKKAFIPPTEEEVLSADYGKRPANYVNIIKRHLEEKLKDPWSARYKNFTIPEKHWIAIDVGQDKVILWGWRVCVEVNAKNSFGGYIGFRRYYFLMKNDLVLSASLASMSKLALRNNRCWSTNATI